MAVIESWKISGICQCSACEEARAELTAATRDYPPSISINAPPLTSKESGHWAIHPPQGDPAGDPPGDPPGLRRIDPALTLELKEPWQRASPFALQLSAAALDAALAPLAARVAALEAENARLTELTGHLVEWATMEYESEQALDRIKAWIVNKRLEMLATVQP